MSGGKWTSQTLAQRCSSQVGELINEVKERGQMECVARKILRRKVG